MLTSAALTPQDYISDPGRVASVPTIARGPLSLILVTTWGSSSWVLGRRRGRRNDQRSLPPRHPWEQPPAVREADVGPLLRFLRTFGDQLHTSCTS